VLDPSFLIEEGGGAPDYLSRSCDLK